MKKTYTAKISRNFRDINLTTPKVLLRNIVDDEEEEFRDHAWVNISKKLEEVIPRGNKTVVIQFVATPKLYGAYQEKMTLTSIAKIKILG